jgi:hypothetical protein
LLCSLLHFPVTSSLLGPNILLSTLFSNILSPCFSLSVRDQVSHPYKTGKIIVLCTLIFIFLDSNPEDSRFCTECTPHPTRRNSCFHQHTELLPERFCATLVPNLSDYVASQSGRL